MYSVFVIENPLMDYIMHEEHGFLDAFGARPGTMQLVEHEVFMAILRASRGYEVVPGGSGANTARGLALLIGAESPIDMPCYSGAIGSDPPGQEFRLLMNRMGIETSLAQKPAPTGVSAIVVTPDHERTMFTNLGACRDYAPDDVDLDLMAKSACFYTTGYLWDTEAQQQALFTAVDEARRAGKPVYFDLADPFVVDHHHAGLRAWLPGRVDTLFGNRQELERLTECSGSDNQILRAATRFAPTVVMKIGRGGCLALSRGKLVHVKAESVVPVDTTGAGDSFAAAYLYGNLAGCGLKESLTLGNRMAARIVAVDGCRYDCVDREDVLSALKP
ncbi:MAG: adenosine kinase [Spirochaetales bacterium]|nr:adenosine kinase [Spirochaetales bacterium]